MEHSISLMLIKFYYTIVSMSFLSFLFLSLKFFHNLWLYKYTIIGELDITPNNTPMIVRSTLFSEGHSYSLSNSFCCEGNALSNPSGLCSKYLIILYWIQKYLMLLSQVIQRAILLFVWKLKEDVIVPSILN